MSANPERKQKEIQIIIRTLNSIITQMNATPAEIRANDREIPEDSPLAWFLYSRRAGGLLSVYVCSTVTGEVDCDSFLLV